jgi:hypothetical protein
VHVGTYVATSKKKRQLKEFSCDSNTVCVPPALGPPRIFMDQISFNTFGLYVFSVIICARGFETMSLLTLVHDLMIRGPCRSTSDCLNGGGFCQEWREHTRHSHVHFEDKGGSCPQGHSTCSCPQEHSTCSCPQGHSTCSCPQGHSTSSCPQGHSTSAASQFVTMEKYCLSSDTV